MRLAASFGLLAALLSGASSAEVSHNTLTHFRQNNQRIMAPQVERALPSNADAERTLLGAILLDNRQLQRCEIAATDFYLDQHQVTFRAIQSLVAARIAADLVTVTDALNKGGLLERAGGAIYVSSLIDGVPTVINAAHYARLVREATQARLLIAVCEKWQVKAYSQEASPRELAEAAVRELLALQSQSGSAALPSAWSEAVNSAMDEVVRSIQEPHTVSRFVFGIPKLDEATSGLRREDVVLIVGGTSHGKSLLAMQLAVASEAAGYKGLIFSAEMSKESLAKRELAHTADIPLWFLRRPEQIRDKDGVIRKLQLAAGKEMDRKLWVVDRDITPARIWSLARLMHQEGGLDFVVVDYDQLVIREGLRRSRRGFEEQFSEQAQFMNDALNLAKELKVCFVLLCQPRKVSDDVARGKVPPRVEEIFGSSAAANTAHHILWIIRRFFQKKMDPKYEDEAVCYLLKARNDRVQHVDLRFDPKAVRFTDSLNPRPDEIEQDSEGE